jgi:integrase/recombinase XerD
MSDLHGAVDDYLTLRRSLGHKLERHNRLLHDFVEFLHGRETTTITTTLAVEWATMPAEAQPGWWATRLGVVRVFAKHHQATDPATEVPPADVFPAHSRRAEPFIYTDTQIRALLAAADKIHTPLKAATYGTLIGLLAVTGMRVGEAIRLDRTDFDPDSGVLTIRDTKFGKTRRIPLHPSTTDALVAYSQLRDTTLSTKRCEALFVSTVGTRLFYENVHPNFQRLTRDAGITARSERCRPRIHCLRHTFAVVTLTGWYRDGLNIDSRVHLLSTYLGHTEPSSTYWYLEATPELLGFAADRLEAAAGVLS